MLRARCARRRVVSHVLNAETLANLQAVAADVFVDRAIIDYAVRLTNATRRPHEVGMGSLSNYIAWGASPRGSVNLIHAAQALALVRGRRYVLPADVTELAPDILRHRIVPSFAALAEEVSAEMIIARLLPAVPVPQPVFSSVASA